MFLFVTQGLPWRVPKKSGRQGTMEIERYKFVTSQLSYFNDKIIESFKLYIQLISAVTGGYVAVRTQAVATPVARIAQVVIPGLTVFIGLGAVLLILVNLSSWWGFREAESRLLKGDVPPPVFPRSARQELVMIAAIVLATTLGAWFFSQ